MGLSPILGRGPVAVDTAVFIYLIEEHPAHLRAARALFEAASQGDLQIVTSALTLLEVLVVPYRRGDDALASDYEAILTNSRAVRLIEIDRLQLRTAAQLRAAYGPRTPDALQLAAALTMRCTALVTNDRRYPPIPSLPIVQLPDLLS